MSSQAYLGDQESLKDLESHMTSPDREVYESYKHLRVDAAFLGRIFIIYKPTGLTKEGQHKSPEVVGQVRVIGFSADPKNGASLSLENMETGEVLTVGHIPTRLFNFDAFVASPPFQRLRWDGRVEAGTVRRSLAFGILLKTRTRSDHYSMGATMVESPKVFRTLYPQEKLSLQFL